MGTWETGSMSASTRNLAALPDLVTLEKITQSLAMLDAVFSPEWESRYFSFNAQWNSSAGERMASMRNGSGDEYFLLFTTNGAILKGFGHESPMSPWSSHPRQVWPGVLDHVPEKLSGFLSEPAFNLNDATLCIWRTTSDSQWHCGPVLFPEGDDPDGSEGLLWALDGNTQTYATFAREYFEVDPDVAAIEAVFQHRPLTPEIVARLNPLKDFDEALQDAEEIGYGA